MTLRVSLFLISLIISAIGLLWGGYVSAVLWGWFATPLGAPAITPLHGAGLALLLGSLLGSRGMIGDIQSVDKLDRWEKLGTAIAFSVVVPALALMSGFLVRSIM